MKKLKKITWEQRVFEIMDVFLTKYGHETSVIFFGMGIFLTKYGHESWYFFVKIVNKGVSFRLFWPIIYCSFDKIDVFLTKYGHASMGFFMKNLKKWHESTVFLREWTFFGQNISIGAVSFLENGRFVGKIWAWEHSFFRE